METHDLGVQRAGHVLLSSVSVSLRPGEVTAILGPNGAGKSTLLRCLSGIERPDYGRVLLDGLTLSTHDPLQLARRRAMLSQHSPLNFPFRTLEIVLLGRNPHHGYREGKDDVAIAEQALREVEAWHLHDRLYPTLSGGERQRVHLARALAQLWTAQNGILLLDEPTSALDLKHQHGILALARQRAREQGMTVICVLHDPNLACHYADTAILLREGRVFAAGRVDNVLCAEHIMTVFELSATMYQRHVSIELYSQPGQLCSMGS